MLTQIDVGDDYGDGCLENFQSTLVQLEPTRTKNDLKFRTGPGPTESLKSRIGLREN